jgi:polysaccharide export outer membrane protein
MRWILPLILMGSLVLAQKAPSLMEEVGHDNLPAQRLGVDDLISVSVYDAQELTRSVRVEQDGDIWLPLLQEGIKAAGLFPRDLETSIAEALRAGQILVDPIVKVTVAEYHSRPIAVMGAVKKPLTFQAVGAVTLLDALAKAEGLSADAGTEVIVSRPSASPNGEGGDKTALLERISLIRLLRDADPTVNSMLHGGEEIRVPEAGKIFVVGNVRKPGAFPVRDAADHSVLKLVALSEGLMPYASNEAYIYRRNDSGGKQEIVIPLARIMGRKEPDIPLQVDDVLYIPDNKTRRNAASIIDRIASFGTSTASGVLIWGH